MRLKLYHLNVELLHLLGVAPYWLITLSVRGILRYNNDTYIVVIKMRH
jgi:hypothetical protein